ATDAAGNSSTCSMALTVDDSTPPTLSCFPLAILPADANCQAEVPNLIPRASAADNCTALTVTQSPAAGTLVGLGSTTITVTAIDAAGNSNMCSTLLRVIDITPPVLICPPPITVAVESNCQAVL